MLFTSPVFVFGFLPVVMFCYYVLLKKSRKWQNILLTITSLFFYAWGEPRFVLIMVGSILANWIFALLADKYRENQKKVRLILTVTVACNIGLLFVFKYLTFVVKSLQTLTNGGLFAKTTLNIALPIGISFFTFHAISYVFDVYKGRGKALKNPLNVALYISFFPQLVAGPIVRYETIADQIHNRKETFKDFSEGVQRFMTGFAKKMLIANNIALVADAAFAAVNPSVSFAWIGAIAYTLQIFFDFSAYSDMALGLGKMFGFHFLENFNYPYISKSISEFWRRWHISLGTWFRDYLYIPLGGSRVKSKGRLVFNLFAVWFLTGVWHGANWTFLVWGLMYFALITAEKLTGFDKKLGVFGYIYTLLFAVAGWVVFRADNLSAAVKYLGNMAGVGGNGFWSDISAFYLHENMYFFGFAILFSMPFAPWLSKKLSASKGTAAFSDAVSALLLILVFIVAVSFMIKGAYNPFIYFNF